jgi:hypothetical protein
MKIYLKEVAIKFRFLLNLRFIRIIFINIIISFRFDFLVLRFHLIYKKPKKEWKIYNEKNKL